MSRKKNIIWLLGEKVNDNRTNKNGALDWIILFLRFTASILKTKKNIPYQFSYLSLNTNTVRVLLYINNDDFANSLIIIYILGGNMFHIFSGPIR